MSIFKQKNPIFSTDNELEVDKKIKISVTRVTGRAVTVSWTEIPFKYFPTKDSEAYLECSDSPVEGFEPVETITRNHPPYWYDRETILNYYRSPVIYYRIVLPEAHKRSQVFSSEKSPNLYGAEISKRHQIMLKEGHAGNLMYLFIKRRSKEQCPDCFDTYRGQRSMANCPTCLNTGFIGGYYNPIPMYVSVTPENVVITQPLDGTMIEGELRCWTTGFPRISMGDVFVDAGTNEVWNVQQVTLTTHKRTPTKQEFTLKYQEDDLFIFSILERVPREAYEEYGRHGESSY